MRVSKDRLKKIEKTVGGTEPDYMVTGTVAGGRVFAKLYDMNDLGDGDSGGRWKVTRLIDGELEEDIPELIKRGFLAVLDDDVESARRVGLGL